MLCQLFVKWLQDKVVLWKVTTFQSTTRRWSFTVYRDSLFRLTSESIAVGHPSLLHHKRLYCFILWFSVFRTCLLRIILAYLLGIILVSSCSTFPKFWSSGPCLASARWSSGLLDDIPSSTICLDSLYWPQINDDLKNCTVLFNYTVTGEANILSLLGAGQQSAIFSVGHHIILVLLYVDPDNSLRYTQTYFISFYI